MPPVSFYFLNVATTDTKITKVACIIFLLESAVLDESVRLYFSNNLFLALLFQRGLEKEMDFVARKTGDVLPGFKNIGLSILNSENCGGFVTETLGITKRGEWMSGFASLV